MVWKKKNERRKIACNHKIENIAVFFVVAKTKILLQRLLLKKIVIDNF